MSIYNTNFKGQSNVAYEGTLSDLNLSEYSSFLTPGADMELFGEDTMPQKHVSFAPLPSYENSGNNGTVCMQQIENAQSTEQQWIPSANEIPAFGFDSDFSPTFTNETSNSTDPSPTLSNDMSVDGLDLSPLFHDVSGFNSADPSPLIRDDLAVDDQHMPSLYEAPKQPTVAPRTVGFAGYESSPASVALASPKPAVLGATSSGVRKNKRAPKVLPEINPDLIEDPIERKRAKNTAAARKSRQKKVDNEAELGAKIERLEFEKKQLRLELEAVKRQLSAAMAGSPPVPAMGLANNFGSGF